MIDTDKYEGHTEGLWLALGDWKATKISNAISNAFLQLNPNEIGKANARLAADAPLLLAEVKRLREAIKVATMDLEEPNMHDETRKDLLDMLKEMIE